MVGNTGAAVKTLWTEFERANAHWASDWARHKRVTTDKQNGGNEISSVQNEDKTVKWVDTNRHRVSVQGACPFWQDEAARSGASADGHNVNRVLSFFREPWRWRHYWRGPSSRLALGLSQAEQQKETAGQ